jgi:hypothetical protein
MQVLEQFTGNTAQMVVSTSPMDFFSTLQHIESRIYARTLDILSARSWEGPLTLQDWHCAEQQVLDPVEIATTLRPDGLLIRASVPGYCAADVRLHLEGDSLYLCGYTERGEDQTRMFYTCVKVPPPMRGSRCAAWVTSSVLYVSLYREQVVPVPVHALKPIAPRSARADYAAAV